MGDSDELKALPRGFRGRTVVAAKLATRVGVDALRRSVGRGTDIDALEQMADQRGNAKGILLKLGQMMSYMDSALPPSARKTLERLQHNTPPMAYERVAAVVQEDLGASPEELFEDFERRPFAAASIGQVHWARWKGQALAVKVQYPEVAQAIREDLGVMGRTVKVLAMASGFDGPALTAELRERFMEELDYQREAANQQDFERILAVIPGASVPRVVRERTGSRVLSSRLVDAMSMPDFARTGESEARGRASRLLFLVAFKRIFRHGLFNADPHPGNYLVADDGAVTFLDFGCVKRFEPDFVLLWKKMARSILENDLAGFRDANLEAGIVRRARRFDWEYQLRSMRFLYEPMLGPQPFTFTEDYVSQTQRVLLAENPNKMRMDMPRDWLFVNRLQWGLYSILASLQAPAPYGEIFRAAVEAPFEGL